MTDLIVICEGHSEVAFVNRVLYQALSDQGLLVKPRLVATSRHSSGGALTGRRVLSFVRKTLREPQNTYVTTFFDLYALPSDFPGQADNNLPEDPVECATAIAARLHTEVVRESECHPDRFIPHIQPYEFESLLFSDTSSFARAEPKWHAFADQLEVVRQAARTPEHINDGPETHPSARLRQLVPRYAKVRHGVAVSTKIGIARIRAECHHFDRWLTRLETLPPLQDAEQ